MKYYILKQEAEPANFMKFWARRYYDKNEPTYRKYIQRSLTPDSVRNLFAWKAMRINRGSILAGKHPFVEAVIANLDRFKEIPLDTIDEADHFLTNELKDKGMIWKIFALHILHPDNYPIFDQNVYRAMVYMKTGIIKEIPGKDKEKQWSYISEYIPFFNDEHEYFEDRMLDKALFSFGQFLKIPLELEWTRELQDERGNFNVDDKTISDSGRSYLGAGQTRP